MNPFDIALVVLVVAGTVFGLVKGLVRLLLLFAALVVGYVLASRYHESLAGHWQASGLPEATLRVTAYAAIVIGVLLVGVLIGFLLRTVLAAAALGWLDRLAGGAVGLAGAVLLMALIALPVAAYTDDGSVLRESRTAPYVSVVADALHIVAPDGLALRYEKGIDGLRRRWRGLAERHS